jgi:ABC-type transport system substrate-binding protein
VPRYDYDPARAARLLDEAGHAPGANGVRFHLTMKTSNDEGTRLLAAVLQQQLAKVGIALDLRSYEFATFYSDVTRGAFQMYSLRWIGGNEQPDIFSYAFSTRAFLPRAPTAATTRIRGSTRCSTMRPRARTRPGGAPITRRRSRFWRAICRPSISGTGTRSWCITGG